MTYLIGFGLGRDETGAELSRVRKLNFKRRKGGGEKRGRTMPLGTPIPLP